MISKDFTMSTVKFYFKKPLLFKLLFFGTILIYLTFLEG